jgi:large subunit ribosomal protein L31e
MATIERTYNVPLRSGFRETARWKRAKKAMTVLREFLIKHTKREDVKIGRHLNEFLWKHGIKNPPHHVKVTVWIEDDHAKAELFGNEFKGAIKARKKDETGSSLKDKLQAKLGKKNDADKEEKSDDKKKDAAKSDDKKASDDKKTEAKPSVKKSEKIDSEKSDVKAPAEKKAAK